MADVVPLGTRRLADLALDFASHPSVSFTAARRVQTSLADQPPHVALTAATLVRELVESARTMRGTHGARLEVFVFDRIVRVTVEALGLGAGCHWPLDGLPKLLLERLSSNWGQPVDSGRTWFELVAPAHPPPARGAA